MNAAATGDLTAEFDVEEVLDEDVAPSWNIAPTDAVRIVVQRSARQLRTARWGLVPSWAKDARGGARMINARIETVTDKPAFKTAAARRRCLVPALGYYEWQRDGAAKIPYFLHDPSGRPLAFAGLYEFWRDPARPEDDPTAWLLSCTIITAQADDLLGQIHDRTPVLVPPQLRAAWLDCSADDAAVARRLLDGMPEAHLEPYVVGAAVGNVRNDGPHLIDPVADDRDARNMRG